MATGKYIKKVLLFVSAAYILGFCTNPVADVWLPDENVYKYSTAFAVIDQKSKANKRRRSSVFIKIRDEIDALYFMRYSIKNTAKLENRNLRNQEQITVEKITQDIQDLDESSNLLSSFRDEQFSEFSVEYGASDRQSVGIKLRYITDEFIAYDDLKEKEFFARNADFFYKYQIFKNDKWIVTIKPTVQFSLYRHKNPCEFVDISLLTGYSKHQENTVGVFYEFSFGCRKYYGNSTANRVGYFASTTDGMKFKNGIMIINFVQYEKSKLANMAYSHTIYEQISIAKEFKMSKLMKGNLTAQVGYFWKSSLVVKSLEVSGPILSIWFNV